MTETEFRILVNEKICDLADVLMLHYNPCQWQEGKCLRDRLTGAEPVCCRSHHYQPFNAEGNCPMLGPDGCTVKRASCKLWFCETAIRTMDPAALTAFKILESIVKLYDLGGRPWLGDRYAGKSEELRHL